MYKVLIADKLSEEAVNIFKDNGIETVVKTGWSEEDLIKELEKQYGFDKPPLQRFFEMLKNYLVFDFGESFYKDKTVISLILENSKIKLPW